MNNAGTKSRFLALRSGAPIIDGSDSAFNPVQLASGEQAKLTMYPEYFNAQDNMFAGDRDGRSIQYKRRGSVVSTLQQTKGSADVMPLGVAALIFSH